VRGRYTLGQNLARLHGIDVDAKKAELGAGLSQIRKVRADS
jgi:hypothetical protein